MGYVGKIKDSSGTTHLVASTLFGTCSTAIGTAAKVVTCSNFSQLENGVTIHVYFVNGNTAASPTLNVNSTGAIAVKRYGTTAPQCSTQNWAAGQIVSFTYYEVSSTDKRWVMNDIDQRFDLLTGTGETAQDKGEGVSPRYFPAKWKFNLNKQPQDGDIITIRIPCAGHNYGVYISLDNGTNYKPVSVNSTTRLTTHYANGKTITLVYESAGSTASIYPVNGGDATQTVDGGCWTVLNYYDYNSDTKVTQTNTTGNASYRVLFSNTADNTNRTEAARKSVKLQFNPSTCTLQLYNESTTATNAPATILFSMKDTTTGKTYNGGYIKVYQDHGATPNGDNMVINSGGGMFLGSGESPSSHYSAKGSTYTGEDCFITADGSMHLQANGNTIANRKGLQITNGFALVPEQADVATDNVGSIGTSSYRWANGYFTKINGVTVGNTPVFTDSKVEQNISSSTNLYPILFSSRQVNDSSTGAYVANRNDQIYVNPDDGYLRAQSLSSYFTSCDYLVGDFINCKKISILTTHEDQTTSGEITQPFVSDTNLNHYLPSTSGTLLNDTDFNEIHEVIFDDTNSGTTATNPIDFDITDEIDRIKYIDILYTDTNYQKTVNDYNIKQKSENFGFLRIPFDKVRYTYSISANVPSTLFSLSLIGDKNSYYIRKQTYALSIVQSGSQQTDPTYTLDIREFNSGLVIQFYGTPGTGSWSNMTTRAQYTNAIRILKVVLIKELKEQQ